MEEKYQVDIYIDLIDIFFLFYFFINIKKKITNKILKFQVVLQRPQISFYIIYNKLFYDLY